MPVERSAIDAQLREIGEGEHWWEQREFRALPQILRADEAIRGIVVGKLLLRRPRLRPAPRWLIVATEQRLICVKQDRVARRQVEIPADQITRLAHGARLRSYQIIVEAAQRRYRIRIPKADAFRFVGALSPLVPQAPRQRLSPEVEALSWIPGITTVAALPGFGGIISRVVQLSPPNPNPPTDRIERLEATVDRLQDEVERLREQVAFLEELLDRRSGEALLQRSSAES